MAQNLEIIGEVVDDIRRSRLAGERLSSIVKYLAATGLMEPLIIDYLDEAFRFVKGRPSLMLLPRNPDGSLVADALDRAFEGPIEESREVWSEEGPYPDLMRRRDRHAFRAVARATDTILIVRSADRWAARYIGAPGFRPAPPELAACARATEPNRALMAADPNDPRLPAFIASRFPGASYAEFVRELAAIGFSVTGPEAGYIVKDGGGNAFYPGYYLLGAYSNTGHRNAWTGRDGERIRFQLNRHLGEDLVQWGPWDAAENRESGPSDFEEPCFPALFFFPTGDVKTRTDLDGVESLYHYLDIDWDRLHKQPAKAAR
jgi:hypothetical protein